MKSLTTTTNTRKHWLVDYIFHYCTQPIPTVSFFNSVNVQPLTWFMNIQQQNRNNSRSLFIGGSIGGFLRWGLTPCLFFFNLKNQIMKRNSKQSDDGSRKICNGCKHTDKCRLAYGNFTFCPKQKVIDRDRYLYMTGRIQEAFSWLPIN